MCAGVVGEGLMFRLGEDGAAAALRQPSVAPMDFTGRRCVRWSTSRERD
jgi:hypothetical protein